MPRSLPSTTRLVGDEFMGIDGYVLELEGDGYSLLKAMPVPK